MAIEGVLNLVEIEMAPAHMIWLMCNHLRFNKNFRKTSVKLALKPPSQSVY